MVSVLRDADVAVLVLDGELDVAVASRVDAAVGDCVEAGASSLVVDASRLSFCDSTGLGALLRVSRRFEPGRFLLAGAVGAVSRLVELTGSSAVLGSRLDVDGALLEVRGPRAQAAYDSLPTQRSTSDVH